MATDVKKTDHLFVPFNRFGHSLNDSKLNTKVYKSMKLLEHHNKKDNGVQPWEASDCYSDVIEYVPVVHGRWIHPKGYVVSNGFLCSECGHEESSRHVINPLPGGGCKADENGNFFYPPKTNYCPNCGADMREREDN